MKKKFKILLAILIISVSLAGLFIYKQVEYIIDRLNPLVKEQYSYAKVPYYDGTRPLSTKEVVDIQDYKGIVSYDKSGVENNYLLSFKGNDPSKQFVKIKHKGKYVYNIDYITKNEYENKVHN
nr:YxeA family protein [Mammaliicoccus sp. Marseille-Q6498]